MKYIRYVFPGTELVGEQEEKKKVKYTKILKMM
jgi:hypothetical protein